MNENRATTMKKALPVALTIAGSDSGGGAGIQADLKTFAALAVHGTTAITCLTAQNPRGVLGIQACRPEIVRQQIEAVFAELPPRAIKTGMLYSKAIIRAVLETLPAGGKVPLVVDPVMVSTSGATLLKVSAIRLIIRELLPRATLITPNLDEATILTQRSLKTLEDLRTAAKALHEQSGCAVLLKGGHLRGGREAADVFFDGRTELLLTAPFVRGVSTHGTGCTYSAAITAFLARGYSLPVSVEHAKQYITDAIRLSHSIASHSVLHHG
jgi:hydroxymethylpyrimidine/phosphomethylpyrimidine kinase